MSQRDRLLNRRLPPTPIRIRVDFTPESEAARAELAAAQAAAATATTEEEGAAARQRVEVCEARWDEFHESLVVQAMAPDAYDALISEHPPTEENRALGHQWDSSTFVPALLAACIGHDAVDPMTEKDWAEWMVTPQIAASGEVALLFQTCIDVNDRSPDVHVGKG